MKSLVISSLSLIVTYLLVAAPISVPVVSTDTTSQTATDNATVKVSGKGSGTDKVSALKDAMRDAVERAVGMFVDAEQLMKNDELISDQILTMSNAYVTKYDVVKESSANGVVSVKILAEVKKSALTKKIMDVMPTQKINVGASSQNLFANVVTKDKRDRDSVALLQNFLKDKNPSKQLVRVTLDSPEPKVLKNDANSNTIKLGYLFKAEIDQEKYTKEFLPQLTEMLGQITVTPPQKNRLMKDPNSDGIYGGVDRAKRALERYKTRMVRERPAFKAYDDAGNGVLGVPFLIGGTLPLDEGQKMNVIYSPEVGMKGTMSQYRETTPCVVDKNRIPQSKMPVRVITSYNSAKTSFTAMDYVLENNTWPILIEWLSQWQLSEFFAPPKKVKYNVIFKDDSGAEVSAFPCELSAKSVANLTVCGSPTYVYVTPFIQNAADAYYVWWNFEIAKDDLAKIKSIDIELAD